MTELRGKPVVEAMEQNLTNRVTALKEKGVTPALAIVRVGERPDDLSYERGATNCCSKLGMEVRSSVFPGDVSEEDFIRGFATVAEDPAVHGILLLHPLPGHIDLEKVKTVFPPEKDIDCLLDENLGKIFTGDKNVAPPCTAQAVMELLHHYNIPLSGKHVVVCGRSMVVGKPLSQLLLNENATVTVCHSRTEDMPSVTKQGDVVVTAVGRAKLFRENYFAPGQTVIDVGINMDSEGKLCGDVDFAAVSAVAEAITPVPGGIGAVTTRVLAQNCIAACERKNT